MLTSKLNKNRMTYSTNTRCEPDCSHSPCTIFQYCIVLSEVHHVLGVSHCTLFYQTKYSVHKYINKNQTKTGKKTILVKNKNLGNSARSLSGRVLTPSKSTGTNRVEYNLPDEVVLIGYRN